MFKRLTYRVRVKTRMVWSERLQRKVWKRDPVGRMEVRERPHLHMFFKDGVDAVGTRWKSQCGRYCHAEEMSVKPDDMAIWVQDFLQYPIGKCTICWGWLRKNKDSVMTAERLNG